LTGKRYKFVRERVDDMTLPGYDPDDLDTELEAALSEGDLNTYLDPDERARYEEGESIVDLLSAEEISEILGLDEAGRSTE
jgi:hypothetical protein